jgi:hypothetical protein
VRRREQHAADLARAKASLTAVTAWIAARDGSIPPDAATLEAAAEIIATPTTVRDTWVRCGIATVHGVNGCLIALYRDQPGGPVTDAQCSCGRTDAVCEHLLVALVWEVPR